MIVSMKMRRHHNIHEKMLSGFWILSMEGNKKHKSF